MSEKPKMSLDSPDTVVGHSEIGMDGVALAPVLEKIDALGRGAIEGESYDNPVIFKYDGETKVGQAMFRTEDGTFIVWSQVPPLQPGQVTGELGNIPLKPYRIPAEDLRPLDPNIDIIP